jgi:type VI secretion system protein ImpA
MESITINQLIKKQTGFELSMLLAAISEQNPGGDNLRFSDTYKALKQARQADDPSIPRGEWAHDLKQANWAKVIEISASALSTKSKDLQIAIWLCEAQLHRYGFAGLAPAFRIVEQLCRHYWPTLYPQPEGGDQEYRTNILSWANEKFMPLLSILPLNPSGRQLLAWEDLEIAMRNEQIQAQGRGREALEGFSVADCQHIVNQTPSQEWADTLQCIDAGVNELQHLTTTLNELCGEESPSLGSITDLLNHMADFLRNELHKRGYTATAVEEEITHQDIPIEGSADDVLVTDPRRGRMEAYAQLEAIADYLAHIEPHSPVPSVLKRMVEWGNMSTSDLYRQLFVQGNGQINIFDLLGLDKNAA